MALQYLGNLGCDCELSHISLKACVIRKLNIWRPFDSTLTSCWYRISQYDIYFGIVSYNNGIASRTLFIPTAFCNSVVRCACKGEHSERMISTWLKTGISKLSERSECYPLTERAPSFSQVKEKTLLQKIMISRSVQLEGKYWNTKPCEYGEDGIRSETEIFNSVISKSVMLPD